MEKNINERLQLLRQALPKCYFQVVSIRNIPLDDGSSSEGITEQIVIYDFPYSPDFYTSEVKVIRFPEKEKIFFNLRVQWVDPREMDALFDGVPPSQLKENFLAESGAIEDIYDFWRISLGELGFGFSDVGLRDFLEIDIQEENPTSKFTLIIEFSLELKNFGEVIDTLTKLNEMWKETKRHETIIRIT